MNNIKKWRIDSMKLYKMLVREFLAEYTKALRTGRDLTQ